MKSSVEQIRQRFDKDVERFSNLEVGHSAIIDSPLMLDLLTKAAAAVTPGAVSLLDIGSGAGNYSLKMLQAIPGLQITLVDLSQAMLERAVERLQPATTGAVVAVQGDIRELELGVGQFDLILAGAVFHHLRSDEEWQAVFAKCYRALRPGGSMWIADMIEHSTAAIQALMWLRFGDYLTTLRDEAYRQQVFAYIAQEDTPRPLLYQLDLLRTVGFVQVEILHKNSCFAAFGGLKSGLGITDP